MPSSHANLFDPAMRFVGGSVIAFAVGAFIAWSMLRSFDASPPSMALNQPIVESSRPPITAPPVSRDDARAVPPSTAPIAPRATARGLPESTPPIASSDRSRGVAQAAPPVGSRDSVRVAPQAAPPIGARAGASTQPLSRPDRAADRVTLQVPPVTAGARPREALRRQGVVAPRGDSSRVATPTVRGGGAIAESAASAPPAALTQPTMPKGDEAPAAVQPPIVLQPVAAAPAPAAAALSAVAVEQNAVREIVLEYTHAYQAMDVTATAAVWPSVDRRALARAFATLKSQELELANCEISIAVAAAIARCVGTVEYVRKVGNPTPRTGYQEWVFKLRKLGDDWIIDGVDASQAATLSTATRRGES